MKRNGKQGKLKQKQKRREKQKWNIWYIHGTIELYFKYGLIGNGDYDGKSYLSNNSFICQTTSQLVTDKVLLITLSSGNKDI